MRHGGVLWPNSDTIPYPARVQMFIRCDASRSRGEKGRRETKFDGGAQSTVVQVCVHFGSGGATSPSFDTLIFTALQTLGAGSIDFSVETFQQ